MPPPNSAPRLNATLSVPLASHRQAAVEAKRFGLKIGEYGAAAIDYFAQRNLNPVSENARQTEVLVGEIRKLGNRLFGFATEQERGLLQPMLLEMVRARIVQEETMDYALQTLLKAFGRSDTLEASRVILRKRVEDRIALIVAELGQEGPGKQKK